MSKHLQALIAVVPATVLLIGANLAAAGEIREVGAITCVTDKWDEKEQEKDHKLVDYVGRCVIVPDAGSTAEKYAEDCLGKYEYMPDKSWKATGTCTRNLKSGDKVYDAYEEGSHLKAYVYKTTGGTGKHKDASGGGTYMYDNLTDTLMGGRIDGKLIVP